MGSYQLICNSRIANWCFLSVIQVQDSFNSAKARMGCKDRF